MNKILMQVGKTLSVGITLLIVLVGLVNDVTAQPNIKKIVVDAQDIKPLDKEYFAVKMNGKWGVHNLTKLIIPYEYDSIDVLSDSIITFIQNGKAGFADLDGKVITSNRYPLKPDYETANTSVLNVFSSGSAIVLDNGEYRLLDRTGKYIDVGGCKIVSKIDNTVVFIKNAAYGIMDANGKVLCENRYRQIQPVIAGSLYAYTAQVNGMDIFGLIDNKGEQKSPAQFDQITIINKGDNFFIKAFVPETGKQALYDENGNLLFRPLYQNVEPTGYDFYFIVTDNTRKGVIGRDYNIYVPTNYDEIEVKSLGKDTFFVAKQGLSTYIIDKDGSTLDAFEGNIQGLVSYKEGEILYLADSMLNYGIRSSKRGWIVKPQYLDIFACAGDKLVVRKKNKWGAVDFSNKEIIPMDYNRVRTPNAKTYIVFFDGGKQSVILKDDGTMLTFPKTKKDILTTDDYVEYKVKDGVVRLYIDGKEINKSFKSIGGNSEGALVVGLDKGKTYVNSKTFVPLTTEYYEYAGAFKGGYAYVVQNNFLKIIDNKFQVKSVVLDDSYVDLSTVGAFLVINTVRGINYYVASNKQGLKTLLYVFASQKYKNVNQQ